MTHTEYFPLNKISSIKQWVKHHKLRTAILAIAYLMSVWVYHVTQPFDLENGWEQAEYNFSLPDDTIIEFGNRNTQKDQLGNEFCRIIKNANPIDRNWNQVSSTVNANTYMGERLNVWTVDEGIAYYQTIVTTYCPENETLYEELFTLDNPSLNFTGLGICQGVRPAQELFWVGGTMSKTDSSILVGYRFRRELREVYCPETIPEWSKGIVTTQTNNIDSLFAYRLPWRPQGYHQGETSTGFKWYNHLYP